MGQSQLLLESALACGPQSVREFSFLGKETAQEDVSDSATSVWHDLGLSKTPMTE